MQPAGRSWQRRRTRPSPDLGFRRIDAVLLVLGEGRPFAEVTGVAHRCPRRVRTSLTTANRLVDAGVPLHIEHRAT